MESVQGKLKMHRETVLRDQAEAVSTGFSPTDRYQQCSRCKAVYQSYWKRNESGGSDYVCLEVVEEEAVAARLRGLVSNHEWSDSVCAACCGKREEGG